MKAAAVLLGPAGVGLIGIYQNVLQTTSTVTSLGLGTSGTRQIASAGANGDDQAIGTTRRALFWGTMGLSLLGAAALWLASGWIARVVLGDATLAQDVAWLSIGVAFTVSAGSQAALLTGLRRIGDLAKVQVLSGIAGTAPGLIAIAVWGIEGLLGMVLLAPFAALLIGHWYVSRLGPPKGQAASPSVLASEFRRMAVLGFAFMISGVVATFGQLAVRSLVQHQLGTDALGQFQAAWSIGMIYLSFALGAMTADYYPRLTAAIHQPETAIRIVNEQTEVALLLCGPVIIAMLALAPWVIRLLYTADFGPAVHILRWQLLGDILKVVSWPLGYLLLAAGSGKTFIFAESLGYGAFVLTAAIGLRLIGIEATGVGFLLMYAIYLPTVYFIARMRFGFRWESAVLKLVVALAAAATLVAATARVAEIFSELLGLLLALGFGFFSIIRLQRIAGLGGRVGRLAAKAGALMARLGIGA